MISIEFTPYRDGLLTGVAQKIEILLRVTTGVPDRGEVERKRAALNLALVIDRSGSMNGRPLHEAMRCAEMVVDRLGNADRLSIVAYDSTVDVVVPSTYVTDKPALKTAIRSIKCAGMTALYDGWHAGAVEAAAALNPSYVSRVLLLSDGCANVGPNDLETLARHCATIAEAGVSTSTYGLGLNFNENIMTGMAEAGQGQSHYGQAAEDLMDPFQQEFDLISALIARRLRLHLVPVPGVKIRILNGYAQTVDGATILPDLAIGGEVWALLEIDIPESMTCRAIGDELKLLEAKVEYRDIEGAEGRTESVTCALRLLRPDQFAAAALSETVIARTTELRVARLQEAAADAARRNDWQRVDMMVAQIRELGEGNEWLIQSLGRMQRYAERREASAFSKEATYKSASMRSRMAPTDAEPSAFWSVASEAARPSYLRRKIEQGKRFREDDN